MRVRTEYIYEFTFTSPHDADFVISACRAAAREWATCSNEGEPLCMVADQLERQKNEEIR